MSLQTNIVEICEKIEQRLITLVPMVPAQIGWSARQATPHIQGKADINIRPRRGQQLQSFEQGGQRYGMVCVRVVDIILRTSYASNEMGNDKGWFKEHIGYEDAILNALAGQMLTDEDGEDYLTRPMLYMGTAEETKETDVKAKNLWGYSVHSFEFHFKPKLDLAQLT